MVGRTRNPGAAAESREDDPRFVTALARGIDVLRAFRSGERWLAHRQLVARTGLAGATVSRLTFTLVSLGYLRHRPASGEYALSPAVLGLGFSMLSNFDIGRIARPMMQALADASLAAVSMAARHGLTMVYVAHCRSPARLVLGLDVGAQLPLPQTSVGRAVLCAMPAARRERLMRDIERQAGAEWPALEARLADAQQQFDRCGFVTVESEWEPSIAAAAVPLDLGDGRELLSLSVGGAAASLHGSVLQDEVGPRLLAAAREIVGAVHAGGWDD
jgi:DNA-binding IclR family transcriptional regulator